MLEREKLPASQPALDRLLTRQGWMDWLADLVQKLVGGFYTALGPLGRPLKDVMHGTAVLRHPLHPALTDAPLGAWLVGLVLDYAAVATHAIPARAGDIALAAGTLAALGAAATGYTDFHETYGLERRTALTHGLLMTLVVVLEIVSLALRWADPAARPAAIALATVAALVAMVGMYVGGHLTFGFGTMVNRNAFLEGPAEEFVDVGASAEFAENTMRRVDAAGMPALVVRLGGRLYAIGAVCSHAGGPLDEGQLEDRTVTCPWHGSRFRLEDGAVRRGPATFSQPSFLVQETAGRVRLKLATPAH
jgi:nitrite reductase/ring-hydroxylating ferredoxin subunit/uncharacterized membrane protein